MPNFLTRARTYFCGSRPPLLPAIDAPLAPLRQYAAAQGASLLSLTQLLRYVFIDHPTERVRALLTAHAVTIDAADLQPARSEHESKTCPGVSTSVEAIVRLCVSRSQFTGNAADTFDSTELLAAIASHCPSSSELEAFGLCAQKVLYLLRHGLSHDSNIVYTDSVCSARSICALPGAVLIGLPELRARAMRPV